MSNRRPVQRIHHFPGWLAMRLAKRCGIPLRRFRASEIGPALLSERWGAQVGGCWGTDRDGRFVAELANSDAVDVVAFEVACGDLGILLAVEQSQFSDLAIRFEISAPPAGAVDTPPGLGFLW